MSIVESSLAATLFDAGILMLIDVDKTSSSLLVGGSLGRSNQNRISKRLSKLIPVKRLNIPPENSNA